jgi:hypothetical protein
MYSDPMEGSAYTEGYQCGMNSDPWTHVRFRYAPGTRGFHKWLEGYSDGCKARHLIKHTHKH